MNICVVGSGYVGLVTAACLADSGQTVVSADVDAAKIRRLEAGEVPIFEPGLEEMIRRNAADKRLSFTHDVTTALAQADVVFVAVGTPPRADGGADLRSVDAVAEAVCRAATREVVLVLKSTVPVGTNERVRKLVTGGAHPVHVVSNPEFLKEGDAIADFQRPDRIVIGCAAGDAHARDVMQRLYHPFCLNRDVIVWMEPSSAELTKYAANTLLAMRISFMNEMAALCEAVGADVHEVRLGVGSDARIGSRFLFAGPGYGGSCFPKDVKALVQTGRDHGIELELTSTTDRVNERQKGLLYRKVRAGLGGDVRGKRVAVWGVAFKPRTDDIREAPALTLVDALVADGASVAVHDPEALERARERFGDKVGYATDMYEACRDADALVLVTEWRQYQNPDFDRIRGLMRSHVLVDGRNVWTGYGLDESGFAYQGIGTRRRARTVTR